MIKANLRNTSAQAPLFCKESSKITFYAQVIRDLKLFTTNYHERLNLLFMNEIDLYLGTSQASIIQLFR